MSNFGSLKMWVFYVITWSIVHKCSGVDGIQVLQSYQENCSPTEECDVDAGLTCRGGTCLCPTGHNFNFIDQNCVDGSRSGPVMKSIQQFGEPCTRDERCDFERGMICVSGVCKCAPSYVISNDSYRCLKETTHAHDGCLEDRQCQGALGGDSACQAGVCACRDYATLVGGRCRNSSRS